MTTTTNTMRVRWGLLRPGATVISDGETHCERKVVTVEHLGSTVSVLFWDGSREHHGEDGYAQVRLAESTHPPEPD